MTNLIDLELTTMTANELREISKEFQMVGSWKAKKAEMIDFLEVKKSEQIKEQEQKEQDELVDFINEVVEIELEKPVKPKPVKTNKQNREIILFDNEDNFIGEFENQKETARFCQKEKLANSGWVARSVRTGERFYLPNGKPSKSQKSKYSGIGYYAMKKSEQIKEA